MTQMPTDFPGNGVRVGSRRGVRPMCVHGFRPDVCPLCNPVPKPRPQTARASV